MLGQFFDALASLAFKLHRWLDIRRDFEFLETSLLVIPVIPVITILCDKNPFIVLVSSVIPGVIPVLPVISCEAVIS